MVEGRLDTPQPVSYGVCWYNTASDHNPPPASAPGYRRYPYQAEGCHAKDQQYKVISTPQRGNTLMLIYLVPAMHFMSHLYYFSKTRKAPRRVYSSNLTTNAMTNGARKILM